MIRTLVKVVLVLLRGLATTSSLVHLVGDAAEEATAALLLLLARSAALLALGGLLLAAAAGELVDEVHVVDGVNWLDGWWVVVRVDRAKSGKFVEDGSTEQDLGRAGIYVGYRPRLVQACRILERSSGAACLDWPLPLPRSSRRPR